MPSSSSSSGSNATASTRINLCAGHQTINVATHREVFLYHYCGYCNWQSCGQELIMSTLAMTDALVKLLIAKGVITDEEFKARLSAEQVDGLVNSFSRVYFRLSDHSGSTATD